MTTIVEYVQGAELDSLTLEIEDGTGALVDMSTGYSFSLKVGTVYAAGFTKTASIGGISTGCQVSWLTSGELNTLAPGEYTGQITCTRTSDSRQYIRHFTIRITPAVL